MESGGCSEDPVLQVVASKAEVTQENGKYCYKYYKPLLVSSQNSRFSKIPIEEVAMDREEQEVTVSVGSAGEENELEGVLQEVEVGVGTAATTSDATQQKGRLCILSYTTCVSVQKRTNLFGRSLQIKVQWI
jgi:hypothetical protein